MSEQADEIRQWISKGDHDLGTAKITYLHVPEYLDTVTFHCQQAVEKYLKAFGYQISVFLGGYERTPKTQPFHIVNR